MTTTPKRKSIAPSLMSDRRQSIAVSDHSGDGIPMSMNRRMSRMELPGNMGLRRMTMYRRNSGTSVSDSGKFLRLENTYALGPKPNEKFDACKVKG